MTAIGRSGIDRGQRGRERSRGAVGGGSLVGADMLFINIDLLLACVMVPK